MGTMMSLELELHQSALHSFSRPEIWDVSCLKALFYIFYLVANDLKPKSD